MSVNRVIEIARGELGVTEEPVNRVKYNTAYYGREVYGKDYAWCVVFLWWVFREAGERMAFFGGGKTARCSVLLQWYREQGLTVPVEQVQAGDIVILNFSGTTDTEHCGLVTGTSDIRNLSTGVPYSVWTIEGNTSSGSGSQSAGDCVAEKIRYPSQIVAVCRPQYKPEPEIVDDITGHWAEDAIRWCMAHELMHGYPDGSFGPDKPVTRAELATVLKRFSELTAQIAYDIATHT